MGEVQPGQQARLMSQALRKLTASISRSNTMVIFINQIRMKIGVMYGSPETTTGGNALKFYVQFVWISGGSAPSRSVRMSSEHDACEGREEQGGSAFQAGRVRHHVWRGVSKMGELVDLGVKAGIVEKSGAWFSYDSQRLGQGRENAKVFLKQNRQLPKRSSSPSVRMPVSSPRRFLRARLRGGRRRIMRSSPCSRARAWTGLSLLSRSDPEKRFPSARKCQLSIRIGRRVSSWRV